MIKTDRIAVWILILSLCLVLPSWLFLTMADEMSAYGMLSLAILDSVVNNRWRRYTPMWIFMAIMLFYVAYTLIFKHYNTALAVLSDAIIQGKPFYPFFVMLGLRPVLTGTERTVLKAVALVNIVVCTILMLIPISVAEMFIGHISIANITIFECTVIILYCITCDGRDISRHKLVLLLLILSFGLLSFKAKFFAEYVVTIFLFFFYRVGMFRHIGFRQLLIMGVIAALVLLVTWNKITYYFLNAGIDIITLDNDDSFARPVLYVVGTMILFEQFPFGSGLASFATTISGSSYSKLYAEYGIDQIWGLSEEKPDFITDAYYPSLAQFGVVGICLYIWFWVFVYRRLLGYIRRPQPLRWPFVCGVMIITFCLSESVAGSTFASSSGFIGTMLLGLICSHARASSNQE